MALRCQDHKTEVLFRPKADCKKNCTPLSPTGFMMGCGGRLWIPNPHRFNALKLFFVPTLFPPPDNPKCQHWLDEVLHTLIKKNHYLKDLNFFRHYKHSYF